MFVSFGIFLRAEEPEPATTFHFGVSSRSGRYGRASRLLCRCATSISSYRALPCFVKRARNAVADSPLRSASEASSFSTSSSVSVDFSAEAMRSSKQVRLSHRSPLCRAACGAAKPNRHSRRAGPRPARRANAPRVRAERPSVLRSALREPGKSCCLTSASRIFSRALRRLLLFLGRIEILANFLAEFVEGRYAALFTGGIFREFVVQFGQLLFLDALHFHGIVVGLSRQLGIGIVVRIARIRNLFFRPGSRREDFP